MHACTLCGRTQQRMRHWLYVRHLCFMGGVPYLHWLHFTLPRNQQIRELTCPQAWPRALHYNSCAHRTAPGQHN